MEFCSTPWRTTVAREIERFTTAGLMTSADGEYVLHDAHLADKAAELERWADEFEEAAVESDSLAERQTFEYVEGTLRKRAAAIRRGDG